MTKNLFIFILPLTTKTMLLLLLLLHKTLSFLRCLYLRPSSHSTPLEPRGGGFFHRKGTWGCAARKGKLFRTSPELRASFFAIVVNFSLESRQGYALGNFWPKKSQTLVIPVWKPKILVLLVQRKRKFGTFCLENTNSWHLTCSI